MMIENKVRCFISENFLYGDSENLLDDDNSFLENGIIDSTGMLELVMFVEKTFNIQVYDEELIPENFDSISQLVKFIEKKKNGKISVPEISY